VCRCRRRYQGTSAAAAPSAALCAVCARLPELHLAHEHLGSDGESMRPHAGGGGALWRRLPVVPMHPCDSGQAMPYRACSLQPMFSVRHWSGCNSCDRGPRELTTQQHQKRHQLQSAATLRRPRGRGHEGCVVHASSCHSPATCICLILAAVPAEVVGTRLARNLNRAAGLPRDVFTDFSCLVYSWIEPGRPRLSVTGDVHGDRSDEDGWCFGWAPFGEVLMRMDSKNRRFSECPKRTC
jgi:hypothetical protein